MYHLKYPLKSIHVYAITSSKEETMIIVHSVLMFENALAFLIALYLSHKQECCCVKVRYSNKQHNCECSIT